MRTRETDVEPFVNLSELTEIELLIMRRMREFTIGEHRSLFTGSGFDFVGLRDWQPGDRTSNIDWAQSTLTNFSPMIVRDYEQRSTATVVAIADASLSTRCGIDGVPIAAAIARTIGTIGMSAVFFQDLFGLMTFDVGFAHLGAVRPRIGKNHVIHCLDAYQHQRGLQDVKQTESISRSIAENRSPACQSRRPTKSKPLPWKRLRCSPIVNSRIRLKISSSISVISARLTSGGSPDFGSRPSISRSLVGEVRIFIRESPPARGCP